MFLELVFFVGFIIFLRVFGEVLNEYWVVVVVRIFNEDCWEFLIIDEFIV